MPDGLGHGDVLWRQQSRWLGYMLVLSDRVAQLVSLLLLMQYRKRYGRDLQYRV